MDTPNTRSRAKRELEIGLNTPGASQDEPRVLWEHDRRWKREFVDNMRDDALPIPAPTQQPSLPRFPVNAAASNRPRKRPCNRNRSVPTGSLASDSPLVGTSGSSSAPSATGGRSNIDKLLEDYFALHGGGPSSSRQPAPPMDNVEVEMASSPSRRSTRETSAEHPLPQMSSLALHTLETPSRRSSAPSNTSRAPSNMRTNTRQTPQRPAAAHSSSIRIAQAPAPAPSPLRSLPIQPSQSRRLGPTLSQGESAKHLGPTPRIGLRTTHDATKPPALHNPAKAFRSPLPGAAQGVRSSPRRQPPAQVSPNTTTAGSSRLAAGPVRVVQGQSSKPAPSPLRNARATSKQTTTSTPKVKDTAQPMPLKKLRDEMPSSDGPGTGDESFGSLDFDLARGGDDIDAFLAQIDGI